MPGRKGRSNLAARIGAGTPFPTARPGLSQFAGLSATPGWHRATGAMVLQRLSDDLFWRKGRRRNSAAGESGEGGRLLRFRHEATPTLRRTASGDRRSGSLHVQNGAGDWGRAEGRASQP